MGKKLIINSNGLWVAKFIGCTLTMGVGVEKQGVQGNDNAHNLDFSLRVVVDNILYLSP